MSALRPTLFTALALTVSDVGALRGLTTLALTDAEHHPVNIYMIMGPNGAGKTTLLDAIYHCHRLLDAREHPCYGWEAVEASDGGVQLDALAVDGAGFQHVKPARQVGPRDELVVWRALRVPRGHAPLRVR